MADAKVDSVTDLEAATPAPRPYVPPAMRHLGSVRELTMKTTKGLDFQSKKATSTREAKNDIRYLDDVQRKEIAGEILGLRLASYEYKPDLNERGGRALGFIVEDAPNASFVLKDEKKVDLYAFASAIAAVVQEQAATIKVLEDEIRELKLSRHRS